MAIKILTIEEAKETEKLAHQFGEHFEAIVGKAKQDYICDNSGKEIPQGEYCAAVLVLPNKNHINYEHQKAMLGDYVTN